MPFAHVSPPCGGAQTIYYERDEMAASFADLLGMEAAMVPFLVEAGHSCLRSCDYHRDDGYPDTRMIIYTRIADGARSLDETHRHPG